MSVNYGMVEETRRLGAAFKLVEAGGYPNLERQRAQIRQCVASGADVLVVGTVSFEGLTDTILEIARDIPVLAAVNDISKVVADYFTHPVYRGIKRGRILAAPTDFPVLQGRLAIDQAIRILEGKLTVQHARPTIEMVTPENVDVIGLQGSLAPASFSPTFIVE